MPALPPFDVLNTLTLVLLFTPPTFASTLPFLNESGKPRREHE